MSGREAFWVLLATILLLTLFFVIANGSRNMSNLTPAPTTVVHAAAEPRPEPRFDWKVVGSQEFAMQPSESREAPNGTTTPAAAKFRLAVSAAQPVSFGFNVVDSQGGRVIQGAVIRLFVRDERKPNLPDATLGALALLLGRNSKPIENATETNRVKLDMYVWTCIANCAP